MGTNFRTIAQRVVERAPGWALVLVDLRGHGASQGLPAPHDLRAAANDLFPLAEHAARELGAPVRAIMGHSFGGKVALDTLAARPHWVEVVFVLDSDPGTSSELAATSTVEEVLGALEAVSLPLPSREAFQAHLRAAGFGEAIVAWLSMNVRRDGDAYALRLDLPAVRSMLEDYRARDLWGAVTSGAAEVHVVVAGRASAVSEASRARLGVLAKERRAVVVHDLPDAGHWVHVDAPDEIVSILAGGLNVLSSRT